MADPVRTAIVAKLSSVANIGRVHSYERYAKNNGELADLYAWQGQLRGWFVRRVSAVEVPLSMGYVLEKTQWQIRGYMALADATATELAFDDLIDAVRTAFRLDPDLGGVVMRIDSDEQAGLALVDSGPVLFAGVLCHAARLALPTERRIIRSN